MAQALHCSRDCSELNSSELDQSDQHKNFFIRYTVQAIKVTFALALLCASVSTSTSASFDSKMDVVDMGALATGRPSTITVWYPRGTCADNKARLCLSDAAVTSKVVVFSHGSMGSAENYSWLGEGLARAGFVTVGVNHFGESRVYGESTQNPRTTALVWQRAQDISALLTKLSSEGLFQRDIDWSKVVAAGHSGGGQTAAMLAGARFDLRQVTQHCETAEANADLSCNYSRNSANAPEQFVAMFNGDYRDSRVRKIVLLDPAQGSALRQGSLSAIALPSLIVGATNNDFLPWRSHGERYAAIPNAQIVLLKGQEGHFVFLTPCQHQTRVMGVPLCEDRPGVDRAAVHRDLTARIIEFVKLDNEPAPAPPQSTATSRGGAQFNHGGVFEILLYTPRWVFALLAGLCVFGLVQVPTRRVAWWLALLLPIAMPVLSLSGVLQYASAWALSVAAWALGLSASTFLFLKMLDTSVASYDRDSDKLIVAGSWVPLLVILGIFCVRYAMAVGPAMELETLQAGFAPLLMSLFLGAFSGFFLARGLLIWGAYSTRRTGQLPAQ